MRELRWREKRTGDREGDELKRLAILMHVRYSFCICFVIDGALVSFTRLGENHCLSAQVGAWGLPCYLSVRCSLYVLYHARLSFCLSFVFVC